MWTTRKGRELQRASWRRIPIQYLGCPAGRGRMKSVRPIVSSPSAITLTAIPTTRRPRSGSRRFPPHSTSLATPTSVRALIAAKSTPRAMSAVRFIRTGFLVSAGRPAAERVQAAAGFPAALMISATSFLTSLLAGAPVRRRGAICAIGLMSNSSTQPTARASA